MLVKDEELDLKLPLPPPRTVRGSVRARDGRGVPGARIKLTALDHELKQWWTDRDGQFAATVRCNLRFTVTAEAREIQSQPAVVEPDVTAVELQAELPMTAGILVDIESRDRDLQIVCYRAGERRWSIPIRAVGEHGTRAFEPAAAGEQVLLYAATRGKRQVWAARVNAGESLRFAHDDGSPGQVSGKFKGASNIPYFVTILEFPLVCNSGVSGERFNLRGVPAGTWTLAVVEHDFDSGIIRSRRQIRVRPGEMLDVGALE